MDGGILTSMFHVELPVIEKIIRPIIVYIALVVGLRLAGKRELAQLNTFDLVVLLTLSNTVQNAIIGSDNSVSGGLIGMVTLLILNYAIVRFMTGHSRIEKLVEGNSAYLIREGKIQTKRLRQEMISLHELEMAARKQGFASLKDIEEAVLDPSGALCFIPKKPEPEVMRFKELAGRLERIEALLLARERPEQENS
ncbi:MAG: YetF domain-containing protein [Bacteroidota bacterium]